MAVENNTNLWKKTKLDKIWGSAKPRYLQNGLQKAPEQNEYLYWFQ